MNRNFTISAGGDAVLRCSRYSPSHPADSLIVIAHGYKGFKDWGMFPYVCESLSARGHEVIAFNFSHGGIGEDLHSFTELDKFARNTCDRELLDLEILVSHLSQDPELGKLPLFLLGHSLGGGVSLVYALDHPDRIAGVLSWNGVTDLDLFTEEQKREMREHGRSYVVNGRTGQQMPLDKVLLDDLERQQARYDIFTRIADAKFPVVLIQGTEDGKRLRLGSEKLTGIRPDISWVQIPGGNHTFGCVHPFKGATPQLEQAIQASSQFVRQVLETAASGS